MADDFYRALTHKQKNEHQIGQLFWVPTPMTPESNLALRISSWKAGLDITKAALKVTRLAAEDIGGLSEQERMDMSRMVIPELNLDSSEDLLLTKVKRRPAVLVLRDCYNMRRFADRDIGLRNIRVEPNRHVFAPVYSLRKEENLGTNYPDAFVEKAKEGKYPNVVFLPAFDTLLKNDSMLLLSELFAVGINSMSPTEYCIDPLLFGVRLGDFTKFIMDQADELSALLESPEKGTK